MINFTVSSQTGKLQISEHIVEVLTDSAVDKIPTMVMKLVNNIDSATFESIYKIYKASTSLEVTVKHTQNKTELKFVGFIKKMSYSGDSDGHYMYLELKHQAFKLTNNRRFVQHQIDNKAMSVQYNCSDWDHLMSIADRTGRHIICTADKESVLILGVNGATPSQDIKDIKNDIKIKNDALFYMTSGYKALNADFIYQTKKAGSSGLKQAVEQYQRNVKELEGKIKNLNNEADQKEKDSQDYPPHYLSTYRYKSFIYDGFLLAKDLCFSLLFNNDKFEYKKLNSLTNKPIKEELNLNNRIISYESEVDDSSRVLCNNISNIKFKKIKFLHSVHTERRGVIRVLAEGLSDIGVENLSSNKLHLGALITINIDKFKLAPSVVSSIKHTINKEGWYIDIGYGLSPKLHIEEYFDINAVPASGESPSVNGMLVGQVTKVSASNSATVEVNLLDGDVWEQPELDVKVKARKMALTTQVNYSNTNIEYPLYEKDDFIIINFLDDNPNNPVAVGYYHTKNR